MNRGRVTSRAEGWAGVIPRLALSAAALFTAAFTSASALGAGPVTISGPVGDPLLNVKGTGLCAASAVSPDFQVDFVPLQSPAVYNAGVNTFIENHAADRVEQVIRTVFDLSNNNDDNTPSKPAFGDFKDAMTPACKTGGCNFFVNDTSTKFATRFRGFMNVTSDLVNKPVHFGFVADDAVSMVFYDKLAKVYEIVTRPLTLGEPIWRMTNTVTFTEPGLYPLEILYVELTTNAALEMSMLVGDFVDFDFPFNEPASPHLDTSGFTLFTPDVFFHTLSGDPSFPDLNKCAQCNRQFVNVPGNNGCVPGFYCNEAALCAPCDSAKLCGPTCSPCGGDTPFCVNINGQNTCGGCRDDFDCKTGFSCDPVKHVCNECNEHSECPQGKICEDHACVPCSTPGTCAGNSCNCCPLGQDGKQMLCSPLEVNGWAACVECVTTADCADGLFCDELTGHCVSELKPNATPECCGEACVNCAQQEPVGSYNFCLPGPVGTACAQCRMDMDCVPANPVDPSKVEAKFCLSGECQSCIKDRRCGDRCESCGGDTPYCLGQQASTAKCVRCVNDSQCNGGTCNAMTNECDPGCPVTCDATTPFCDGTQCVECYADTQCPCGATCDLGTHTCSESCKTNADCLGNEHCKWEDNEIDKDCALGPMPGDVACGGTLATACEGSIGDKSRRTDGNAPPVGLVGLALLALLGRRRIRGIP